MKLRLFLFLFLACTLLAGSAMAQGCTTNPYAFPPPGGADKTVPPGTCLANSDADGKDMQGGRLRWDNNSSHQLQLFDHDDFGEPLLWCANSGINPRNCVIGTILCLQGDGNAVIYAPNPGQGTIQCGNDNGSGGQAVWASNTQGANDGHEELTVVEEDMPLVGVTLHGDRAVILNRRGIIWVSTGYSD